MLHRPSKSKGWWAFEDPRKEVLTHTLAPPPNRKKSDSREANDKALQLFTKFQVNGGGKGNKNILKLVTRLPSAETIVNMKGQDIMQKKLRF